MSLNDAVPLSAATTRYGSGSSLTTQSAGFTTTPSTTLSVTSSIARTNRRYRSMPSSRTASRSAGAAVAPFTTNPPLAPTGTITAFFTICAFIRPRISVRKSSARSLHRRPPRAMGPPRRCTPSTFGEHTKISDHGRGSGRNEMPLGRSFTAISSPICHRERKAFVRTVASIKVSRARQIRSSSSDGTESRRSRRTVLTASAAAARATASVPSAGSKRASNSSTSRRAISACRTNVWAVYDELNRNPT